MPRIRVLRSRLNIFRYEETDEMIYTVIILIGILTGMVVNLISYGDRNEKVNLKVFSVSCFKDVRKLSTLLIFTLAFTTFFMLFKINGFFISSCTLVTILITAAIIDVREKMIPDKLIAFSIVTGLAMLIINPQNTIYDAFTGVLIIGGILFIVSLLSKGAIGMGDVKLITCSALYIGGSRLMTALTVSFILSGIAGVIVLLKYRENRRKEIPFAPFLLIGTIIAQLF
jgi:prepilin signal peptidase PulO-like enzyme (type II secretory pathway)